MSQSELSTRPVRELATELLAALASSDLAAVRERCAPNVVMYGTDEGERWSTLASLCDALGPMRDLGLTASWDGELNAGANWVAGTAVYAATGGPPVLTRVSLIFEDGLLVHGHFSIEGTMPVS